MKPPGLSRQFDLGYRSNVFVLVATPAIGLVLGTGGLLAGKTLSDSTSLGFHGGAACFLAWAIAVELHPDRPWLAAVAAGLGPLGLLWGNADVMANASILLVARAVSGTTGRSLRGADLILLGVVAAPIVSAGTGPGVLAVGATGLAITAVWHSRGRTYHIASAVMYATAAIASWVLADDLGWLDGDARIVLWLGLAGGIASLLGPGTVDTPTDRAGGRIVPTRVRAARLVVLIAAALVSAAYEPASMAPAWAALIATGLRP